MCGIIGYIGKEKAAPLLLEGLRKQSYRGYDSSGVVVIGENVQCVKAVGKLENLEAKLANTFLEGNVGVGHCLVPDTLVQMAGGEIKKISNIKDGDEVSSFNPATFVFQKERVKSWKHRSPRYLQEIRTSSTSLQATQKHRIFIWSSNGLQEKIAKDLVAGDILIFPKFIGTFKNSKSIYFQSVPIKTYYHVTFAVNAMIREKISSLGMSKSHIASLAGISESDLEHMVANDRNVRTDVLSRVLPILSIEFPSEEFIPRHSIHGNFITLPRKSSPEIMQIIGYLLGDGHLNERSVRFKDMRKEVLEKYQELFQKVFNLSGRITTMSDTKAYLLEINGLSLVNWFKENIMTKKEKLLEEVGQLPKKELAAFLRGLFDAEGAVGKKGHQIVIGMTDDLIIKTVHLLLLRFGILSSVSDKNTNRPSQWKRPYKISISSRDSIEKFLLHIGFSSREKQNTGENLMLHMTKEASISFKVLPYSKALLREKCFPFISKSVLKRILGPKKHLNNFARESTVKKILSYLENTHHKKSLLLIQELRMFLDGSIVFQEVVSNIRKESAFEFLYDLEVDAHHNFLANGILSHNSRWATHGGVTEANAHPHADCKQNIFVVHNGIIENYRLLREKLEAKEHRFSSETDTEVIPHLIEHFFEGNLEQAVQKSLKFIRGSFGIAVVAKEDPGKVVGARMSSPLVISVNGAGGFIASDPSALIAHSNRMVFLDDGEIAVVRSQDFSVFDLQNNPKEKLITELEWTLEEAQKGGYPHFLLKEIMEQGESLTNVLRGRLIFEEGKAKLGGLEAKRETLREIEKIQIVACGTAAHAGRVAEYMLEEYAGIPTKVDIASEFRYRRPVFNNKTLSLFISQSGETADTLAALKEVKEKGGCTLGVVNVVGSSVAREVDIGVYTHAGAEIAVASTKAFTAQLAALALITVFLGRQRQMSLVMGQRIIKELANIPELVKKVLANAEQVKNIAEKYKQYSNFFLIGRKYNSPIALEGALKIKETAYVHAEGNSGGELKHGSLALIDEHFPTIALCPSDSVYEKMVSNIQEIRARNGRVIAIATEGNTDIAGITEDVIYIPRTLEMLTPILAVIPLQLFAYYAGVLKGYDVDKPRNLAKSVTVE